MSVKAHEAYCLDSAQDRLLFYDDFLGDSIRDLWTVAGTGSAAVVDAQDGGVVRLTTGAVSGNSEELDWGAFRTLHVNKKVTFEARVKLNSTTSIEVYYQIYYDGSNRISFYRAAGNWQITCRNGGAGGDVDSGVAADTDYHIFRIECFPAGEVHFYIDGTECGNSPITTNIPSDAADYLKPRFYFVTTENVAKTLDIDYVVVRQEI